MGEGSNNEAASLNRVKSSERLRPEDFGKKKLESIISVGSGTGSLASKNMSDAGTLISLNGLPSPVGGLSSTNSAKSVSVNNVGR